MAFGSPEWSDYENVLALNEAWLGLLQTDTRLSEGLRELPERLRGRMTTLSQQQVARLAATPLLLFSFNESDDRYWTRILAGSQERDLFHAHDSDEVDTLISASLGFIWQLARRNPYSLRLICGATLYWTERIAEQTFLHLLDAVRRTGDMPRVRLGGHSELWNKLLDSGVSRNALARHAAQTSALQAVLTDPPTGRAETWSLAARSARSPTARVAEENEPTQT
jgi:hypothetical protein